MKKILYDDGFNSYLVEGATFIGDAGIPVLQNMNNLQVPKELIPFTKSRKNLERRKFVHFYVHDDNFKCVFNHPEKYVELFKTYDGIISPDPTMFIDNSKCLLETSTYMNRAFAFYYAKKGIPVIPNIRWTNEKSYEFCFLGIPKKYIVSISTHGCCKSRQQKEDFKKGLSKMLEVLEPTDVIVHGSMPKSIFEEFESRTRFHRFPSEFEMTHKKEV